MGQSHSIRPTACFFAKAPNRSYLDRVEFYKQDIDILRDLGFEVVTAIRWRDIPRNADLYFIWWWTWAFLPLAKTHFLGRPTLITGSFDHWWPNSGWEFDNRPFWEKLLIQYALRKASANVFVSELEYKRIPEKLRVNTPCYSPHIVDTEVYQQGNQPREDLVFTVAWLEGRNPVRKCVPEIIKAIPFIHAAHPSVRFLIAGEKGSYYPKLVELAERLQVTDYVEFMGTISRDEKIDLMQRCKVYLQPTIHEGFGLAILEAMSCGAPVVTSSAGAVPEVVGDAGVIMDGHSPTEIAETVNDLLENGGLREELGKRGRHRAETVFPYERRKHDLEAIIASLLKQYPRSRSAQG